MNGFDMTAADDAAYVRPSARMIRMSDRSTTDIERIIEEAHAARSAYTARLVRDLLRWSAGRVRAIERRLRGLIADRTCGRPQATTGEA